MSGQEQPVKSASRVLDIMELFSESNEPMSTSMVASRLKLPLSSTHGLLRTLLGRGYLIKNQAECYALGPKFLEVGNKYVHHLDLVDFARAPMQHMREICGETISLAVLDGRDVVLVYKCESSMALRIGNPLGTRLPLHASAMGKTILATWSQKELEEFFSSSRLKRVTARTITSASRLTKYLREVRNTGIAYDLEESTEHVHAVAAAINDDRESLIYSLAIVAPEPRAKGEHWAGLARLVKAGAGLIGDTMRGKDLVGMAGDFSVLDDAYRGCKREASMVEGGSQYDQVGKRVQDLSFATWRRD